MSGAPDPLRRPSVLVVGGGLAGMAAAAALRAGGLHVSLYERAKHLGGRAGSFRDPKTGRWIDFCRHVSMGCCTNFADFCRRIGVAECFHRYARLHFFSPDGTRHDLVPRGWLPAPLHLLPDLLRMGYLTRRERCAVVHAMWRLARQPAANRPDEQTIGQWLRRQGQSDRVIDRFWATVLVSALGETVDRASLSASRKVLVDGFLGARRACELHVPQCSLQELFDRRAAKRLGEQGVAVHRNSPVAGIEIDARRASAVVLSDGSRCESDFVVLAVPWRRIRSLFPNTPHPAVPALSGTEQIRSAPITAVHLWFDAPLTELPHAVLIGKLSQWLFRDRTGAFSADSGSAHYHQVVISASHMLGGRRRDDILAEVLRDLRSLWPSAHSARLLHWRVATRPAAVLSACPGLDDLRPGQRTPVENLFLAGDWTATGWPSTMEGAVRSGYLAAEAVFERLHRNARILVPDLPRGRLARVMLGL
ncbi:MAG: FAD-dependent oxidoreductase [Pirellulales bacterium]|nr:FAD-dependent oxidoreductase [Pirellulales bacterium]